MATSIAENKQPSTLRKILVVDDNVDGAESLAALIELWGHEVRIAYEGETALKVFKEFRPQVVLLDIGLPGMNGYEVAASIRALPEGTRTQLVALTGWAYENEPKGSNQAGFDLHLVKPVDPDYLQKRLLKP